MSSQNASPAVKQPQRQRGRDRVAGLLAAAADVFAEKGYDAATMTEIAARAGASIGSLYQFFPTKELLTEALHAGQVEAMSQMLDALLVELRSLPPAVLGDRLFAALEDFLAARPSYAVLTARHRPDPERKRVMRPRMRGQVAALLMQASPPVPADRAAVLAIVVMELIKVVVGLSAEPELAVRGAVRDELLGMLRDRLERG
jgi:AcrR family transcriptional regulator